MSEQAETALESGGLGDLASFLADTPDEESNEQDDEQTVDESTADSDTDEPTNDEQDTDAPQGEDDEPAPVEKITFKVKGEDGKEETVEATTEDIAKSYMRHKDYTQKTQALATRESDAVQFLTQKHEEIRANYLSQAELTRAAIVQMAGIKSEAEMAQLATSDPAAWVAEQQRQRQIGSFLDGLSQKIEGEKQQSEATRQQQSEQWKQNQFKQAWEELSKEKIDKPRLQKIYGDVEKSYGFSTDELSNVYDHRLVKMMRDAVEYRALKAQKQTVMAKVQNAPRMPSRQASPGQERIDKALDAKFKSGRAKLNDLAAFLR